MLRSAHLYDSACFWFFSSSVCSAASNALYSIFVAFCVSEKERVHTTGLAATDVNLILIWALTWWRREQGRGVGGAGAGMASRRVGRRAGREGPFVLPRTSDWDRIFGSWMKA